MFLFLVPLVLGFAFNLVSVFATASSLLPVLCDNDLP
jgi:hypothetical protein